MQIYNPGRYAVSVSLATFIKRNENSQILLIQRKNPPFQHHWALPEGFVEQDETLEQTALRQLNENTGIKLNDIPIFQIGAYGHPKRDPRFRIITIAFTVILPEELLTQIKSGGEAAIVRWIDVENIPKLAFDHDEILNDARQFLNV